MIQNRPITASKETYYIVKRDLLHCQKRPITLPKETYYSVKRDLLQCQKRPVTLELATAPFKGCTVSASKTSGVSKETYYSVKRDLLPRHYWAFLRVGDQGVSLVCVKRDLLQCQNRPITLEEATALLGILEGGRPGCETNLGT